MLPTIHREEGAPQASSIYCRWIRERRKDSVRLVAVWIDRNMRYFELEFPSDSQPELLQQDAWDDPGAVATFQSLRWTICPIKKCCL